MPCGAIVFFINFIVILYVMKIFFFLIIKKNFNLIRLQSSIIEFSLFAMHNLLGSYFDYHA
ncbi:hypothetical protein Syun_017041 [Stephania yunnanensis]|uniref:Uncharacterized protein n=1 Tax=Stephania yunnanensis TaxID=152371 RepID=A0AAP0P2Z7_9MAGN